MKSLVSYILCVILIIGGIDFAVKSQRASDSFIRNRVVQLKGNGIGCTGIQVLAPSGKTYTLTARHCRDMVNEQGEVTAINEQGLKAQIKLVAIDANADLMLLTSMNNKHIEIADKTYLHQKIHTLTHGALHPTYRTDGEIMEVQEVMAINGVIEDAASMDKCIKSGNHILPSVMGLLCTTQLLLQMSTAYVVGGSSGGPALNEAGQLVGIISVSDQQLFSGLVLIKDIQSFMLGK